MLYNLKKDMLIMADCSILFMLAACYKVSLTNDIICLLLYFTTCSYSTIFCFIFHNVINNKKIIKSV